MRSSLLEDARKAVEMAQRRAQIVRYGIAECLQFAIHVFEFRGALLYAATEVRVELLYFLFCLGASTDLRV